MKKDQTSVKFLSEILIEKVLIPSGCLFSAVSGPLRSSVRVAFSCFPFINRELRSNVREFAVNSFFVGNCCFTDLIKSQRSSELNRGYVNLIVMLPRERAMK